MSPDTVVHVRIERLSLEGFRLDAGGERAVRGAVRDELGRLLSAEALPARLRSGGAAPELGPERLSIPSWSDPADLGRQIARALYRGLGR